MDTFENPMLHSLRGYNNTSNGITAHIIIPYIFIFGALFLMIWFTVVATGNGCNSKKYVATNTRENRYKGNKLSQRNWRCERENYV